MAIHPVVLRMSVNQDEQLPRTAGHTAQVDTACRTRRYAIPHHRTARHKQARYLLHQRGQHIRLLLFAQRLSVNDIHRKRQMAYVGIVARTRHDDFLHRLRVRLCRTADEFYSLLLPEVPAVFHFPWVVPMFKDAEAACGDAIGSVVAQTGVVSCGGFTQVVVAVAAGTLGKLWGSTKSQVMTELSIEQVESHALYGNRVL